MFLLIRKSCAETCSVDKSKVQLFGLHQYCVNTHCTLFHFTRLYEKKQPLLRKSRYAFFAAVENRKRIFWRNGSLRECRGEKSKNTIYRPFFYGDTRRFFSVLQIVYIL